MFEKQKPVEIIQDKPGKTFDLQADVISDLQSVLSFQDQSNDPKNFANPQLLEKEKLLAKQLLKSTNDLRDIHDWLLNTLEALFVTGRGEEKKDYQILENKSTISLITTLNNWNSFELGKYIQPTTLDMGLVYENDKENGENTYAINDKALASFSLNLHTTNNPKASQQGQPKYEYYLDITHRQVRSGLQKFGIGKVFFKTLEDFQRLMYQKYKVKLVFHAGVGQIDTLKFFLQNGFKPQTEQDLETIKLLADITKYQNKALNIVGNSYSRSQQNYVSTKTQDEIMWGPYRHLAPDILRVNLIKEIV